MDTVGGMSGGAVVNSDGYLVGIVSSSFEGGPSYVTLIWEAIRLGVKGTVPKLATQESVSLLSAKALGLVKLKGKVDSRPFAVTFTFSDEESKLFADSIPPPVAGADRKPGLSAEQLEAFIDEWGGFMEEMAGDAAIDALEALSLSKMREFLEISRIPANCLEAIHGFSVEDFEGVEDFSITSTAVTGDVQLSIAYYFELPTLIWTVEVDDDLYQVNKDDFLKHFFNAETEDGVVTMEVAQRGYFEGTMMFDRDQEQFIDVSIISSAIRRPPLVVPDR